jgi:hypothetical protein
MRRIRFAQEIGDFNTTDLGPHAERGVPSNSLSVPELQTHGVTNRRESAPPQSPMDLCLSAVVQEDENSGDGNNLKRRTALCCGTNSLRFVVELSM